MPEPITRGDAETPRRRFVANVLVPVAKGVVCYIVFVIVSMFSGDRAAGPSIPWMEKCPRTQRVVFVIGWGFFAICVGLVLYSILRHPDTFSK